MKKRPGRARGSSGPFSGRLSTRRRRATVRSRLTADFSHATLEDLLDEVHESGDKLKENPSVELVQAYKRAVRDFVHYVVDRSYAVEQKTSGRSILKRNAYFRVSVIDESLEKLAAEILRNQRDNLEILRRVDEINGMLVDLLS